MSDTQNNPWDAITRQYTQAWSQFANAGRPPQSAFHAWWQPNGATNDGGLGTIFEQFAQQGMAYLQSAAALAQSGTPDASTFFKAMQQSFQPMLGGMQPFTQMPPIPFAGGAFNANPWANPWANTSSAPMFGAMNQGMPSVGDWLKQMNVGEMPPAGQAIGFHREKQMLMQEIQQATWDYQQKLGEYQIFMSELMNRANERVQGLLQEADPQPQTLRELFDLWIKGCEAEYAEQAMSDRYIELHGAIVDAMMRFKQLNQRWLDSQLAELGIPNRDALKTMQSRIQQQQRELRELKKQMAELSKPAASKPAVTKAAAEAPAAEPAAAKKPAASKTATKRTPRKTATKPAAKTTTKAAAKTEKKS